MPQLVDPASDLSAVTALSGRLADCARRETTVTYSQLVDGIEFALGNGRVHLIDVREWTGLDRQIIGDYLGLIASTSFREHDFMASALAVDYKNRRPSDSFFKLAVLLEALPLDTRTARDAFWIDHLQRAFRYYKSQAVAESLPTARELYDYGQTILEGVVSTQISPARSRCDSVTSLAREHYRSPDGLLHCEVCFWSRPVGDFVGDIVEMHHRMVLAAAPPEGRVLTTHEAILLLAPLCPNCHRLTHARPGGSTYSTDDLRNITKK